MYNLTVFLSLLPVLLRVFCLGFFCLFGGWFFLFGLGFGGFFAFFFFCELEEN